MVVGGVVDPAETGDREEAAECAKMHGEGFDQMRPAHSTECMPGLRGMNVSVCGGGGGRLIT